MDLSTYVDISLRWHVYEILEILKELLEAFPYLDRVSKNNPGRILTTFSP